MSRDSVADAIYRELSRRFGMIVDISREDAAAIAALTREAAPNGCQKCGSTGMHACTGQPARAWTEQEKADCKAAMQRIHDREAAPDDPDAAWRQRQVDDDFQWKLRHIRESQATGKPIYRLDRGFLVSAVDGGGRVIPPVNFREPQDIPRLMDRALLLGLSIGEHCRLAATDSAIQSQQGATGGDGRYARHPILRQHAAQSVAKSGSGAILVSAAAVSDLFADLDAALAHPQAAGSARSPEDRAAEKEAMAQVHFNGLRGLNPDGSAPVGVEAVVKVIDDFASGPVVCLRCNKPMTLYFNGGEMDSRDCCGLRYATQHTGYRLVVTDSSLASTKERAE